jgi:hypothetical protein
MGDREEEKEYRSKCKYSGVATFILKVENPLGASRSNFSKYPAINAKM